MRLDIVVEILLDREIAKNRIMGRRLCVKDNNHPNNIFIDAIKPNGDKCRVCGGDLKTRSTMTRTKRPSTNGTISIMTPRWARWPRLTTLEILQNREKASSISP